MADPVFSFSFGQAMIIAVVGGGFPALVSAAAAIWMAKINRQESVAVQQKVVAANQETQTKVDGSLHTLVDKVEALTLAKGIAQGQALTANQVKEIVDSGTAKVIDAAKNGNH